MSPAVRLTLVIVALAVTLVGYLRMSRPPRASAPPGLDWSPLVLFGLAAGLSFAAAAAGT